MNIIQDKFPEGSKCYCKNCGRLYRSLYIKLKHEKNCQRFKKTRCYQCRFFVRDEPKTLHIESSTETFDKEIGALFCKKFSKYLHREHLDDKTTIRNASENMFMPIICEHFCDKWIDKV